MITITNPERQIAMDLTNIGTIKEIMKKSGLAPNKVMGQHFLISKNVLQKMIDAAEIKTTDTVLEAGPGLGVLTRALAEKAGRVIAIEKDLSLIPILQNLFADDKNVIIAEGDILDLQLKNYKVRTKNYKIVADIPYYLTSRFMRTFLENPIQPASMTLLVQKEVAERICEKPPHASLLSNAVQYYANPAMALRVPPGAFYPKPDVESAILNLIITRKYDANFDTSFFILLKMAFSSPRKQLLPVLAKFYPRESINKWLMEANIGPKQRAQEVELIKWIALARKIDPNLAVL